MVEELTEHELSILEKLDEKHGELMNRLSPKERNSLKQHVTTENIESILSWIGSDREIEEILYWDEGGKYDDPGWKNLKPVNEFNASLFNKAEAYLEQLKQEAIESQRRSDLTLFSQFNTGLLFTGMAGAVRCNADGITDQQGEYFNGIELRCIGSVGEEINSITILPDKDKGIVVHFGSFDGEKPKGILVYTGDTFSMLQLAQVAQKGLPKKGFETRVEDIEGNPVEMDAKLIRKANSDASIELPYGAEMILYASCSVADIDQSFEMAGLLSRTFYERFGLETECYKIRRAFPNFKIMREENFDQLIPPTEPIKARGIVLLTATNVCRRCRRELKGFKSFAEKYPEVDFALVNLSSPQFKFYERVFGDMGDGDPDEFRRTAAGVTPFVIIYAPDSNGILQLGEYYATGKADDAPHPDRCFELFDKYYMSN